MKAIESELDIYELAYLSGGKSRVAPTVIIRLIELKFLHWDVKKKKLKKHKAANSILLNDIEQSILDSLNINDVNNVKYICSSKVSAIKTKFERYGIGNGPGWLAGIFFFFGGVPSCLAAIYLTAPFIPANGQWHFLKLSFLTAITIIIFFGVCIFLSIMNENASNRKRNKLLKILRQRIPLQIPFPNDMLSKIYAIHGSIILKEKVVLH